MRIRENLFTMPASGCVMETANTTALSGQQVGVGNWGEMFEGEGQEGTWVIH